MNKTNIAVAALMILLMVAALAFAETTYIHYYETTLRNIFGGALSLKTHDSWADAWQWGSTSNVARGIMTFPAPGIIRAGSGTGIGIGFSGRP